MGEKEKQINRRDFLKLGVAGIAAGMTATGVAGLAKAADEENAQTSEQAAALFIKEHDEFPVEIREDYKPPRNIDTIFGPAFWGHALMAAGIEIDEEMLAVGDSLLHKLNYGHDNSHPGTSQLAKALAGGAWALSNTAVGPSPGAVGEFGLFSWRQDADKNPLALMDLDFIPPEQYQFGSKAEASQAIKRAARLYGADMVGITKRDTRWDYREFLNPVPPAVRGTITPPPPEMMPQIGEMIGTHFAAGDAFYGWERFPFEPKTVIVVAFEMDYEAISASPTEISAAAVGAGYSQMAKTAYQLAVFIKQLGYHAVACGNDTGLSIPYAIAAGLGEESRSGLLVTPKYGPRVRLAKVYTDLEFVEYDKPITFGVVDFCKLCKRCAESCPSESISFDDEPSFDPTHEDKDIAYFNNPGAKKWYINARNCLKYWDELGHDCINCVASCPYNKPDFWHHRMVNQITRMTGGPLHTLMKEMDIAFGYGNTFDEEAIARFWESQDK